MALGNSCIDFSAQHVHSLGKSGLAVLALEQDRNRLRLVAKEIDLPQLFQLVVFENGPLQGDLAAACRLGLQQIALGADFGLGRGNQFLAQRIERGIGNLGEVLLEVVVEKLRPLR